MSSQYGIATTFIWIVIGLILLVIPFLVWKKIKDKSKSKPKNKASKKLFEILYLNSKFLKYPVFYNLIIRTSFKKNEFIHVPGGIITEKFIFLTTDILNFQVNSFYLEKNILNCENTKGKNFIVRNINLLEINIFSKFLKNKLNIPKEQIKIVILHNGNKIINQDNVYFVPTISFFKFVENYLKRNDWSEKINVQKTHNFFKDHNLVKENFSNKSLEKMGK